MHLIFFLLKRKIKAIAKKVAFIDILRTYWGFAQENQNIKIGSKMFTVKRMPVTFAD